MRRELERVEIPGEHEARERAWAVVREAYARREPERPKRPILRPLLAAAVGAAIVAAALSPPGRAVVDSVREAIGLSDAEEALFSVPGRGRLLVVSDSGAWVIAGDGSTRRLGPYDDAAWSPFGRFVVAAGSDGLAALEPDGDVRWKLARRGVSSVRWGGTRDDTRIAYVSGRELRVVDGDGTGDRAFATGVERVRPAWRDASLARIAYAAGDAVVVADAATGATVWSRRVPGIERLEWSENGDRLLVQARRSLRVYGATGTLQFDLLGRSAAAVEDAAFTSSSGGVAFAQRAGGRGSVWLVPRLRPDASAARRAFAGPGVFDAVVPSPDGRRLLVSWPDADQWLFLPVRGRTPRVTAVANVAAHFDSATPPRIVGWCCG